MKYYIRLIKRKKFIPLIVMLIFSFLGGFMFYYNLGQYIVKGFELSDLDFYTTTSNGIAGIIGSSNIGLALIGLFVCYIGLVFIPVNSIYSQNEEDYYLEDRGDYLYVKCFNREFLVKKEIFDPKCFFFKDKNKKFVSMTKGYQIYNFVKYFHNDLTEKAISDSSKIINKEEIFKKFKQVEKMSLEEKEKYIKLKNINNKINVKYLVLAIICFGIFAYFFLGMLLLIILNEISFGDFIINIIFSIIVLFIGKILYKKAKKEKKLYSNIINKNMYCINCFSCDKKIEELDKGTFYYIKVTDGNYILDHWFKISRELYNSSDVLNIKLNLLDETAEYIFEIDDEYKNKEGGKN